MDHNSITNKICLIMTIGFLTCIPFAQGQESASNISSKNTYHNQLFFNRFLINPTFSLVRENKSYLNILHRNQYATFEDNSQNYFLGFSDKLNENTALGIGVYSQWSGVIQEFGFNANYATSVKLGTKSKLTFGTNVTYFNEGLDKNRVVVAENDPEVLEARKESKIAVQPGITLSLGKFDFGLYAEDLLKYNQTTNDFLTNLSDKSIKASLQYTHTSKATRGLFANARFMPLVQMGKHENGSLAYLGSLLLDMPSYGWLQTTLDDQYGLSMGLGFNISKKMSLGYLLEKDVLRQETDLGWNHELSLAYTFKEHDNALLDFTNNSQDAKVDQIVRNYEEQILNLIAENDKIKNEMKSKRKKDSYKEVAIDSDENSLAYQNRLILDELILRQDSIEEARTLAFEKRFERIVRILRSDIKQNMKSNIEKSNSIGQMGLASNTAKKPETSKTSNNEERKKYIKLPMKVLNQSNLIGVESGYYVIANVYKSKKYLNAFMDSLKEKGLDAKKFYNKANGLYYVYLADYHHKSEARTAYVSNLDGKYQDEKWIMEVNNASMTAANIYEE